MLAIPRNIRSVVDHDGAVILDISRNTMMTLNPTGAYVWERLQRGMLLDEIVAELARETSTDSTVVAADVDAFMQDLKSKHLLTVL